MKTLGVLTLVGFIAGIVWLIKPASSTATATHQTATATQTLYRASGTVNITN